MSGPAPSVAEVRVAVRRCVADLPSGTSLLVACSGGADSVALAAATAFVATRRRLRAGLLTVDHGLQPGSAARAARVAEWGRAIGLDPAEVLPVLVSGPGGPEAAARKARYTALDEAAHRHGDAVVLLGHTRDDQAETVLLGLARGSGTRAAAGMPRRRGRYRRPLLELPRATVASAAVATAAGLEIWSDPHNSDPAYARSRLRALLPELDRAAGPGLLVGLARSAALLRDDADALDLLAAERLVALRGPDGRISVTGLRAEPPAIRRRVLRGWMVAAGAPAGAVGSGHVAAVDALVTAWHGQGPVALPGGLSACRGGDGLSIMAAGSGSTRGHDTVGP